MTREEERRPAITEFKRRGNRTDPAALCKFRPGEHGNRASGLVGVERVNSSLLPLRVTAFYLRAIRLNSIRAKWIDCRLLMTFNELGTRDRRHCSREHRCYRLVSDLRFFRERLLRVPLT